MSKIADQTCTRVTVTVIAREARNYGHSYRRSALMAGGRRLGGGAAGPAPEVQPVFTASHRISPGRRIGDRTRHIRRARSSQMARRSRSRAVSSEAAQSELRTGCADHRPATPSSLAASPPPPPSHPPPSSPSPTSRNPTETDQRYKRPVRNALNPSNPHQAPDAAKIPVSQTG